MINKTCQYCNHNINVIKKTCKTTMSKIKPYQLTPHRIKLIDKQKNYSHEDPTEIISAKKEKNHLQK